MSRPKSEGESNRGHVKTIPLEDNAVSEGLKAKHPFQRAGRLPLPVACHPLVEIDTRESDLLSLPSVKSSHS